MTNNGQTNQPRARTDKAESVALVPVETTKEAGALVPSTIDGAFRLAQWLSNAQLLPPALRGKEADIFTMVLAGMELGLPPMAALRGMYIVNGKPALEAKTKAAICLQRGAALYFKKIEDTDKAVAWETLRQGATDPSRSRFTIDDAKNAGLLGKEGPWRSYPRRMMSWRALGFLCDDTYPDIVLGVATAEDFDEEQMSFKPIAAVGGGVELGTVQQPARAPASVTIPPKTETASPAPPPPTDDAKPPLTEAETVEIIEDICRCGTVESLRALSKSRIQPRQMDESSRARLAKAYEEQLAEIRQAEAEARKENA